MALTTKYQSTKMTGMPPDLLANLRTQRDRLMAQQREIKEELFHLNALIKRYESGSSKVEVKVTSLLKPRLKTKQPRVRGVLAAARKAIEQISGPFDKNQLLAMIERDEEFAHKKITGANIRNTLRLLTQDGVIKVESEATATSCAKYVKTAQAEGPSQVQSRETTGTLVRPS